MASHMFSKAFISFFSDFFKRDPNSAVYLSGSAGFYLLSVLEEENLNRRFAVARLELFFSGTAGCTWFCLLASSYSTRILYLLSV